MRECLAREEAVDSDGHREVGGERECRKEEKRASESGGGTISGWDAQRYGGSIWYETSSKIEQTVRLQLLRKEVSGGAARVTR